MPSFSRLHMRLSAGTAPVPGESADAGFTDQILLTSISWDIGRGKNTEAGADRGKVEPGVFQFSKPMDKASTPMLTHMKNGAQLRAVVTLAAHPDTKDPKSSDYTLVFDLRNVRIVGYKVDGSDGDKSGEIKEDWEFTYSQLFVQYTPPGGNTMTSEHDRKVETTSKSELETLLAKFSAVKPAEHINVIPKLQALVKEFKL